jgi:hypothetical protein
MHLDIKYNKWGAGTFVFASNSESHPIWLTDYNSRAYALTPSAAAATPSLPKLSEAPMSFRADAKLDGVRQDELLDWVLRDK